MVSFKAPVIGVSLAAMLTVLSAQAKPDFSGTWVLDSKASGIDKTQKVAEGRGGGLPTPTQMIIKQSAAEMVVTSATPDSYAFSGNPVPSADGLFHFTSTYRLDGKEFPANCPPCDAQGMATWKDGALTISSKRKLFAGALGYIETEDIDVFSLAGGVLTLERTVDTVDGPKTRKLVYNQKR